MIGAIVIVFVLVVVIKRRKSQSIPLEWDSVQDFIEPAEYLEEQRTGDETV